MLRKERKKMGMDVWRWVCNYREFKNKMEELGNIGIDGIFTEYSEKLSSEIQ